MIYLYSSNIQNLFQHTVYTFVLRVYSRRMSSRVVHEHQLTQNGHNATMKMVYTGKSSTKLYKKYTKLCYFNIIHLLVGENQQDTCYVIVILSFQLLATEWKRKYDIGAKAADFLLGRLVYKINFCVTIFEQISKLRTTVAKHFFLILPKVCFLLFYFGFKFTQFKRFQLNFPGTCCCQLFAMVKDQFFPK